MIAVLIYLFIFNVRFPSKASWKFPRGCFSKNQIQYLGEIETEFETYLFDTKKETQMSYFNE